MTRTTAAATRQAPELTAEQIYAAAADLLAPSLDYDASIAALADLAVHTLADFCIVDIVEDGEIRRSQVAHADPERAELARGLMNFPLGRRHRHLSLAALQSRRPIRVARVTPRSIEALAQGDAHRAIIDALQPRSLMAVPMMAHDRLLGVVLFASSHRQYEEADLALAELLVRTASLYVDNARLYREATRAVAARDRILGIVAHDLRNPLGTIKLTAEVLVEEAGSNAHQLQLAQLILRSATRMNRLIEDLRDVSRIEAGRLNLQRETQEPLRLAAEAVELNEALASGRTLTLRRRGNGRLPSISADRDRILQVLGNLIGNAVKFTPTGGSIEVSVDAVRDGVRFSVTDSGPGMPPESLPHLFEPFWQGQGVSREGMGLGLTIAQGIVQAHGGTMAVESELGHGSTFHFTVPSASMPPRVDRRRGPSDRRARTRYPVPPAKRRIPHKGSTSDE
ncbi:MAG TPA: HAMP domain-containing sensor histidine kinase [Longimicrobiaceae bacterium]